MRSTISGGRRFIGCKELARWSMESRKCSARDLRVVICEMILFPTVGNNERTRVHTSGLRKWTRTPLNLALDSNQAISAGIFRSRATSN